MITFIDIRNKLQEFGFYKDHENSFIWNECYKRHDLNSLYELFIGDAGKFTLKLIKDDKSLYMDDYEINFYELALIFDYFDDAIPTYNFTKQWEEEFKPLLKSTIDVLIDKLEVSYSDFTYTKIVGNKAIYGQLSYQGFNYRILQSNNTDKLLALDIYKNVFIDILHPYASLLNNNQCIKVPNTLIQKYKEELEKFNILRYKDYIFLNRGFRKNTLNKIKLFVNSYI